MKNIIVITWSDMDGSEPTDRTELRDGCRRTVYRTCRSARAVVWSRSLDAAAYAGAHEHSKSINGTIRVMDDDADVLDKARELELASHK